MAVAAAQFAFFGQVPFLIRTPMTGPGHDLGAILFAAAGDVEAVIAAEERDPILIIKPDELADI